MLSRFTIEGMEPPGNSRINVTGILVRKLKLNHLRETNVGVAEA